MKWPLLKRKTAADIRGISDDALKFVHTQNLVLIALAQLMHWNGIPDKLLIDELYARGRANLPKPESKK